MLEIAGFSVQAAAGGAEGLALVEKEHPDLVLLDLVMPEVDGFTVCEQIRKGAASGNPQIVVLTALDEIEPKVRALELGADEVLVKPVDPRELVARVSRMLARVEELRAQGGGMRGQLTVVAGAKGGIGTSTVAANLAATLAIGKSTEAVVLADLAVPVGTLASMLGMPAPVQWIWKELLDDGMASVHRLVGCLLRSQNLPVRLLPGLRPGSPFREVKPEESKRFAGVLHGLAEWVVVDLGNQPSPFAPALLREADVIVVVVEPEVLSVELTAQFLDRLQETGVLRQRIRLVLSSAHGSLQRSRNEVAAELKMEPSAMIVYQRDEFSAASTRRLPVVIQQPSSAAAVSFQELVGAVAKV